MRIISGKYKGKKLLGFNIDGTRPTMDRVKESLFGMIQNYVKNSIVLDLFSGSGSLGLEAISNGAKKAYLVDNSSEAITTIKKNISNMDDDINILKQDYKEALLKFKNENIKFDIIFLDPPYKLNLINDCLKLILEYNLLSIRGIIVCEYDKENFINNDLNIIKEKKYSDKNIRIYKMENL